MIWTLCPSTTKESFTTESNRLLQVGFSCWLFIRMGRKACTPLPVLRTLATRYGEQCIHASETVSDSRKLCWTGCWTVSVLQSWHTIWMPWSCSTNLCSQRVNIFTLLPQSNLNGECASEGTHTYSTLPKTQYMLSGLIKMCVLMILKVWIFRKWY